MPFPPQPTRAITLSPVNAVPLERHFWLFGGTMDPWQAPDGETNYLFSLNDPKHDTDLSQNGKNGGIAAIAAAQVTRFSGRPTRTKSR